MNEFLVFFNGSEVDSSRFISKLPTLLDLVCHHPMHLHFDLDISGENRQGGGNEINQESRRLRKKAMRDWCVSGPPGL